MSTPTTKRSKSKNSEGDRPKKTADNSAHTAAAGEKSKSTPADVKKSSPSPARRSVVKTAVNGTASQPSTVTSKSKESDAPAKKTEKNGVKKSTPKESATGDTKSTKTKLTSSKVVGALMKDTNEHESKVPKSKAPAEKGVDGKSKVKKTTSKPPDTDELKPSSVVRRETGETRVEKVEKQKNPPPVERPVAVVQDEPDYEDDFEEYSDDFEDIDEDDKHSVASSTSETSQAMARSASEQQRTIDTPVPKPKAQDTTVVERRKAELQRSDSMRASVGFGTLTDDTRVSGQVGSAGASGRVVDFSGAYATSIVDHTAVQRAVRRMQAVHKLVDFDTTLAHDLLDMAPQPDYTPMATTAGGAGVQTQTGDDSCERDAQTDVADVCDSWTQHPAGRDVSRTLGTTTTTDNNRLTDAGNNDVPIFNDDHFNARTFAAFTQRCTSLLATLMQSSSVIGGVTGALKSPMKFADAMQRFELGAVATSKRSCACVYALTEYTTTALAINEQAELLAAYHIEESAVSDLVERSMMCRYSLDDGTTSPPNQVYKTESRINCCCFSSPPCQLVFAGLADGSLCCWDTRESSALHWDRLPWPGTQRQVELRCPSYTTRLVHVMTPMTNSSATPNTHLQLPDRPIIQVQCSSIESTSKDSTTECYVYALDTSASVHIYTAVRATGASGAHEIDVGLTPGGLIKLTSVTSVDGLSAHDIMSTTSVLANEFAIDYAGNAFFIALNERAHILHTRRAAGARRNYACGVGMDSVLSVDVQSATDGTVLAASCSDGTISVYVEQSPQPVLTLSAPGRNAAGVAQWVRWSPVDATTLYALYDARTLCVWQLSNGTRPTHTHTFDSDVRYASAIPTNDGHVRMAFAFASGACEVHALTGDKRHTLKQLLKLLNASGEN